MPALPDAITIIFSGRHTQFNGLSMDVLRKNDNILLKINFCLMSGNPSDAELEYQALEQSKAIALIERLAKQPNFKILEAANVPDAQYFAPDIDDVERAESLFIEPAAGKSVVNCFVEVIESLRKMGGKVHTVLAGGQSLRGGGPTP